MFLKSNSSCLMSNFPADILIIDDERQIRRLLNLTLTGAGSAYPYHKDPDDSHLRIAPTYPSLDEVETASALLCVCVRLAVVEKLLADQQ